MSEMKEAVLFNCGFAGSHRHAAAEVQACRGRGHCLQRVRDARAQSGWCVTRLGALRVAAMRLVLLGLALLLPGVRAAAALMTHPWSAPCPDEADRLGPVPGLDSLMFGAAPSAPEVVALGAARVERADDRWFVTLPVYPSQPPAREEVLSFRSTFLGRPATMLLTFADGRLLASCAVFDFEDLPPRRQWLELDAELTAAHGTPAVREAYCRQKSCSDASLALGPEGHADSGTLVGFSAIWNGCPNRIWLHHFGSRNHVVFQSRDVEDWLRARQAPAGR